MTGDKISGCWRLSLKEGLEVFEVDKEVEEGLRELEAKDVVKEGLDDSVLGEFIPLE